MSAVWSGQPIFAITPEDVVLDEHENAFLVRRMRVRAAFRRLLLLVASCEFGNRNECLCATLMSDRREKNFIVSTRTKDMQLI